MAGQSCKKHTWVVLQDAIEKYYLVPIFRTIFLLLLLSCLPHVWLIWNVIIMNDLVSDDKHSKSKGNNDVSSSKSFSKGKYQTRQIKIKNYMRISGVRTKDKNSLLFVPFTVIIISWKLQSWKGPYRSVVPNLGPPGVLGLQLPEILASRSGGVGFWEL